MPYKKDQTVIVLCKTCSDAYKPTKDCIVLRANYAMQCLAHYVDLDEITCLKKVKG